jgi:glucose-1-phosphate cytidylyltransferase
MKAVILAGGLGTRISEETHLRPKPMIEIGGKPIIWHLMKILSSQGINDFIICCGYKGYVIKEYFTNYFFHTSDISVDLASGRIDRLNRGGEKWKVTLVDTGEDTQTGGRLKRVARYIDSSPFLFTYGDGLSDVNLDSLVSCHKVNNAIVTVTAVQPTGRYGALCLSEELVTSFEEKPQGDNSWVNGGFFIMEKSAINFVRDDQTAWERGPLEKIASERKLAAYKHRGFWQAMDTLRDKQHLEELWLSGDAPWKIWA